MEVQWFAVDERSVVFERFDSEIIAINLNQGIYYCLNSTAADIFELIAGHHSPPQIVAELNRKYDGDPQQLEEETTRFLARLHQVSLIERSSANGHAPTGRLSPGSPKPVFEIPTVQEHKDMQELFLLDPVHDVAPEGWPNTADQSEE